MGSNPTLSANLRADTRWLDGRARKSCSETSLLRWVWRAYVRNALVPLLVVELLLVAVYLTSHAWSLRRNVAALSDVAQQELLRIASDESAVIEQKLGQVAALTEVLRRQTAAALAAPAPRARDRQRLRLQASGALTTRGDDGGAAVYWSARTAKGPAEFERLERLASVDPLLRDVTLANPLIVQAYINTHDSLNRIWPWIDAASLYDPGMNIPDFNFYYEADARHNPARAVVWTDAYVDPAGKGWLVSAIAPAYRGDFLEAVVGTDVTIDRIVDDVLSQHIPWQGFLLLIGKSGTLLALPPQGEALFELRELTAHDYVDAIRADTFKPDEFNVYHAPDLAEIGALLKAQPSGSGRLDGPSPHLVAWETIPSVGWKLMSLVPEQAVFGPSRALNRDLAAVGWVMLAGLAGFYVIFFTFLYRRARIVSHGSPSRSGRSSAWRTASPSASTNRRRPNSASASSATRSASCSAWGACSATPIARARTPRRASPSATRNCRRSSACRRTASCPSTRTGQVTETNPAFLAMTGWTRDGLIGLSRPAFWSRLAELGGSGHAGSRCRAARPCCGCSARGRRCWSAGWSARVRRRKSRTSATSRWPTSSTAPRAVSWRPRPTNCARRSP